MKKSLPYILRGLLICAVIGLLLYQYYVKKDLTSGDITKALLILAGTIASVLRPPRNRALGNKKALYQKAYKDFIRNVFSEDPKLEKKFYSAVDDYNNSRCETAVNKLMDLRKECHRSDDIYAVTVFTGLCLDDMGLYEEATNAYTNALRIRPNGTLASNLGLCLQRLGRIEEAEKAYEYAIDLNPDNPFVYNNISAMYFRRGDYETALDYAEHALDCNPNLKEALGTACICFALLGDQQNYQEYYRRAVSAGYSGTKLKERIRDLDPDIAK